MAYPPDIAAVQPVLELTLENEPRSLRCAGSLDARTRVHVVEAVEELLKDAPTRLTVDIDGLRVIDDDGATALTCIQDMAHAAGVPLSWTGSGVNHPLEAAV